MKKLLLAGMLTIAFGSQSVFAAVESTEETAEVSKIEATEATEAATEATEATEAPEATEEAVEAGYFRNAYDFVAGVPSTINNNRVKTAGVVVAVAATVVAAKIAYDKYKATK